MEKSKDPNFGHEGMDTGTSDLSKLYTTQYK